jgi:hypothetical protein
MNYVEIAVTAKRLQEQASRVADPTYGNYRHVLKEYKQILNDILVLIRELAKKDIPIPTDKDTP